MNRIIFLFVLTVFIFSDCSKKNHEKVVHTYEQQFKKDKEITWLFSKNNIESPRYDAVFTQVTDKLVQEGNSDKIYFFLNKTGHLFFENSMFNEIYVNKTEEILQQKNFKFSERQTAELMYLVGSMYLAKNENNKSVVILSKIQLDPKDQEEKKLLADILYEVGFAKINTGKLEDALKDLITSEKLYREIGDEEGIGLVYSDISYVYSQMSEFDISLEYLNKAEKIIEKKSDSVLLFDLYLNKISTYSMNEHKNLFMKIDSLERFYQASSQKDDRTTLYTKSWVAYKKIKEKKYADAKKILKEVEPLHLKNPENDVYLYALGTYYRESGDQAQNIDFIKQNLEIQKSKNNHSILNVFYEILKQDALQRKDYQAALRYTEESQKDIDLNNNIKSKSIIRNLDNKYQLEKKEHIISEKNNQLMVLGLSLFAIVLVGSLFWIRKKLNTIKMKREQELEYSKRLYVNTEEERKRIATELHDGVSHELLALKTSFNKDLGDFHKKIDTIINEVRNISRNLHPIMFDKIGLNSTLQQMVDRIHQEGTFIVNFESNYTGFLDVQEELHVYRMVQEAISNIIKYSEAHAAIISLTESQQELIISIKDNGKGFDVEDKLNNSKSFGLHTIIQRSKAIGAEAKIVSAETGTEITIKKVKENV